MGSPVVLVTGASRGIGKRLALDFAAHGFDVVVVARSTRAAPSRLPGTLDETAEAVRALGQRALVVVADLSSTQAAVEVALRAYEEFGRIDVLINNAAISPAGSALDAPLRRWELAVDINLNAPFALMHEVCPRMVEAGHGRVINISSSDAVNLVARRPSYTTTKRAIEAMSESLAVELQGTGVTVNAIRLELDVWTEGYAFTLGDDAAGMDFEDPVVMSDACLWLARQPGDYTGQIVTIEALRQVGAVRPKTPAGPS